MNETIAFRKWNLPLCVGLYLAIIGSFVQCAPRSLGSHKAAPIVESGAGSGGGGSAPDAPIGGKAGADADSGAGGDADAGKGTDADSGVGCSTDRSASALSAAYWPVPSSFILSPGTHGEVLWRYTFFPQPSSWVGTDFSDIDWQTGAPGFHYGAAAASDVPRTPWPQQYSEIWLRTTFTLTPEQRQSVMFWARWDDDLEIYINGALALSEKSPSANYRYLGMSSNARAALKDGLNTLAVHVKDHGGDKYFDLGIATKPELTSRPSIGFEHTKALEIYGKTMREYMIAHAIPGGTLAVMKGNKIVVSRAFGWADTSFCKPLTENSVLRLAGNARYLTIGAVQQLIAEDYVDTRTGTHIAADTPVFPLLEAHGIAPLPGALPSASVREITVRQLLAGKSGLREPPYGAQFYSDAQLTPGQETVEDVVRWAYSMPPAFTPGTQEDSSHIAFIVLRYLLSVVKGDLPQYLHSVLPASARPAMLGQVVIAHEPLAHRSLLEPWYATLDSFPYRSLQLEHSLALAASAPWLAQYLRARHLVDGSALLNPLTGEWSSGSDNGWHTFFYSGSGAWSLLLQRRYDELSIAALFNIVGDYRALPELLLADTGRLKSEDFGTDSGG